MCTCDCGTVKAIEGHSLRRGKSKSCGCGRRKFDNYRIRSIYLTMLKNCYNEKSTMYGTYGGRGVTVCDEWRKDYGSFERWALNSGYGDMLTLCRIDADKLYSPENCHWATIRLKNNRRSNNIKVTMNISLICDAFGLNYHTVYNRIENGMSPEAAVLFGTSVYDSMMFDEQPREKCGKISAEPETVGKVRVFRSVSYQMD